MALVLSPIPEILDSEEERKLFNAREVVKSASTAINAVVYFRSQIELSNSSVTKEKLDMIMSSVQIYGKDYPEIFFYGVDTLRKGYIKNVDLVTSTVVEGAVQFANNAVNWCKARQDNDLLVLVSFDLLFTLISIGKRDLCTSVSQEGLNTLATSLSREFLLKVSARSGGYIMSSFSLIELLSRKGVFLKEDLVSFCVDFISNPNTSVEDEGSSILFMGSVKYVSACLRSPSSILPRQLLHELVFRDSKLVVACISRLVVNLNARQNLLDLVTFVGLVLNSGLLLREEFSSKKSKSPSGGSSEEWGAWIIGGSDDQFPIAEKLAKIFEAVDIDVIDDIFGAYTSDAIADARDSDIVLGLVVLGSGLVRYYGSVSSGTRKNLIFAMIRKWILSALMNGGDAVVAASGLGLACEFFALSSEPVESLISIGAFSQAVETMQVHLSGSFAAAQAAAFIGKIPNGAMFGKSYFERFFFHPQVFLCEVLKIQFFKSFSMKEILLRVVSVVHEIRDSRERAEVVRVAVQMVEAMKGRDMLGEVRKEVVAIELARGKGGGFLAWMITAAEAAVEDPETFEGLLFLVFEIFLAGSNGAIVGKILPRFPGSIRLRAGAILTGRSGVGVSAKQRDLLPPAKSVLEGFRLVNIMAEKRKKREEKEEKSSAQVGWADSAAGWFLDLEQKKEEKTTAEKKKQLAKPPPSPEPASPTTSPPPVVNTVAPSGKIGTTPTAPIAPPVKAVPKMVGKSPVPPRSLVANAPAKVAPKVTAVKPKPMVKVPAKIPVPIPLKGIPTKMSLAAKPVPLAKAKTIVVPKQVLPGKVPPAKAQAAVPPAPEEPPKKHKKEPPKEAAEPDQGWGGYLGGLLGPGEPVVKEKKKKKKKSSDDDKVLSEEGN